MHNDEHPRYRLRVFNVEKNYKFTDPAPRVFTGPNGLLEACALAFCLNAEAFLAYAKSGDPGSPLGYYESVEELLPGSETWLTIGSPELDDARRAQKGGV